MAHAVRVGATSLRAPPGATDDAVQFDGLERTSTMAYRGSASLDERDARERPVARLPRHEGEQSLAAGDGAEAIPARCRRARIPGGWRELVVRLRGIRKAIRGAGPSAAGDGC
jgi:hypothetical protein